MTAGGRGHILMLCMALLMLTGCSVTKYVPDGQYLLNKVKIKSDIRDITPEYLNDYLQQTPNSTFIGIFRPELGFYNLSGEDSTKWVNRWLRRIGEAPVIYDERSTEYSKEEIEKVLFNRGYIDADVDVTTDFKKKKATVTYTVKGNEPYRVNNFIVSIPNDSARLYISRFQNENSPQKGDLFDVDKLDAERDRIARTLRNHGYYNFRKELLFYAIDSTVGNHLMDIELALQPQYLENDSALDIIFSPKYIRDIKILSLRDGRLNTRDASRIYDTVRMEGFSVISERGYRTFRPGTLISKTYIRPNTLYNERHIERTYAQLNSLQAVKYVNISFRERPDGDLDALIVVSQDKPHTVSTELEGTYSGGDLGIGLGVGYTNNNIFRGAETLKVGVDGGYEAMGDLSEVYYSSEIGGEASIRFPSLLIPFTSTEYKRRVVGNTEVGVSVNFQQRPEYKRNIANASFKYDWRWKGMNFTYNLVDISYIFLPWISDEFRDKYLQPSSSIRFSYENQFIMRMGLGITYTTQRNNRPNSSYFTARASVRSAGNLLYGISNLIGQKKNEDGIYEIFNTQYSQYVKGDFDVSYNICMSDVSRLVLHAGVGVGFPYGNATIMPFEERYYSGGANSVRGWGVRTLGPGSFKNREGYIDFMRQSGDIKLDLNVEGRFKLFWKLEGALFFDAGNIWTIRDYEDQPGGYFRFNEFYKQIACSYGFGLRLDFSFFVIRLDMGIKLYDPSYASSADRWRTEPTWRDDVALHFAVGYPF